MNTKDPNVVVDTCRDNTADMSETSNRVPACSNDHRLHTLMVHREQKRVLKSETGRLRQFKLQLRCLLSPVAAPRVKALVSSYGKRTRTFRIHSSGELAL